MISIMPLKHSFKSDSNSGPSPGHLNLVSDGATSVHVSYLFWSPGVYLSLTQIMASPQAISVLCQMELHLFMSPTYGFLASAISGQGLQA